MNDYDSQRHNPTVVIQFESFLTMTKIQWILRFQKVLKALDKCLQLAKQEDPPSDEQKSDLKKLYTQDEKFWNHLSSQWNSTHSVISLI